MPDESRRGLDSETRLMVIETIRQLKNRLLTPGKIAAFDRDEIFPEEVIRELTGPEIGLQLLFIPEDYGGMGAGAADCCAVTRAMSEICLGVSTALFAIQLGTEPILTGGTTAQKEKWLGKIAQGNCIVAYAVTEPDAGSNVAAVSTRAEPVTDSSGGVTGYLISGTKQFISNGGYADMVTVLAKTPEGPSFFIVEKGAPGFSRGKSEKKHGIRSSDTSALSFDSVFVPKDHLIGEVPGKGMKQANAVFGYTRLMVASMAAGAARSALDKVISYAKERHQFGGPLSEKQGYTHKLVIPHLVRLAAAEAYIDETADRIDSRETDLSVEGSMAKFFATEAADKAANDAIQALGGYGYITEYGVEKIKRDVKITCIYEGASEIQQQIISTFRWKKTRKTKGGFYLEKAGEMTAGEKTLPDAGCIHLAVAAKALNSLVMFIHDHGLIKEQIVMFETADLMTHVEVGCALAMRALSAAKAGEPRAVELKCASRIFAGEVCGKMLRKIPFIVMGTGNPDPESAAGFMKDISFESLIGSQERLIRHMDEFRTIVFQNSTASRGGPVCPPSFSQ